MDDRKRREGDKKRRGQEAPASHTEPATQLWCLFLSLPSSTTLPRSLGYTLLCCGLHSKLCDSRFLGP